VELFKSYSVKPADIQRDWHVIDATGQTLGRLSTQIATLIRGKHKPAFSPHMDNGDFVVVINAAKIRVSGKKLEQKFYYHHSQYPGGLSAVQLAEMLRTHPTRVIEHSVRGMIPDNKLGDQIIKKLKVYAGPTHPHARHIQGLERIKEKNAAAAGR
jgi:large subunit ribosomal protein L13